MSFLAWAFALGGLAIAFPILFHLIRPTPKGSQAFGSLMFLRESPPRISKRNRIDNWLLLLLRAAIVLLVACAFMRPFFRTGGQIFVSDLPGNRVALLVDRSASMRRGDLWQQVSDEVDQALDDLQPGDDVALYAFDRQIQTLAGFSEERVTDLESRKNLVRTRFATLEPSWQATDLGNALASTADFVSELEESRRNETGLQIVLVSDMQAGTDLSGLQSYVWPEDVRVDVRSLEPATEKGNAVARVLPEDVTGPIDSGRRVRLVNADDSEVETFHVMWQDATGKADLDSKTAFYVPPGTSEVLRVPNSKSLVADRLTVEGDLCQFDNQFFVTPNASQQVSIAYFGKDKENDAQGSLYFLKRVIPESKARVVTVDQYSLDDFSGWNQGAVPRMVVVVDPVSQKVAERLQQYVAKGGLLLAVVRDADTMTSLGELVGNVSTVEDSVERRESRADDYAMLASIDFGHPLFRSLSGPRFNDFTNIRFWKHFRLKLDGQPSSAATNDSAADLDSETMTTIIAEFDDDTLAIWQNRVDQGVVVGMASSWRPADSQLALSTKFVPMFTSLLSMTDRSEWKSDSYLVGDSIQLPGSEEPWTVTRPDQEQLTITEQEGTQKLFDQPGIFQFENGDQQFQVAVNLDPAESLTSPLDSASLESFDVRVGTQPSREELAGSLQELKDKQLENRQRLWKWLLLAAICLLVLETLLAGKRQTNPVPSEAVA